MFSSTVAEKKKAPLKACTVLKVTPTPSSSTKSTKTPSLGPHRKSSSKLSPPQPRQNKTVTTKQSSRPSPTHNKPSDQSAFQVPPVGYNHLGRVEIILFIGMNIVFWNCQGLRPKRKELQNYLPENQIDILALNKTFLKPKFKFHLTGYDIYKNDRLVGTKGGVAILVKKGIIVNQEWKNEHFNVITNNEALGIEIELQNGDKVILATIYCPNGYPSSRPFRMINALSNQVIFLGDFDSKHKQFGCVKPNKFGQTLVNIAKDLKLFYVNQLCPNRHLAGICVKTHFMEYPTF